MAGISSEIGVWLKDQYLSGVRNQFSTKKLMFDILGKNEEDIEGGDAVIGVSFGLSQGIGAIGYDGTLPTPTTEPINTMRVPMKFNVARISLSLADMKRAKTDKGSFVTYLTRKMEGLTTAFGLDINRQISVGTGTGLLATTTNAGTASVTMVVSVSNVFYRNMAVDCYSTTGTYKWTDTIVKVDKPINTLTLTTAQTWVVGDKLYRKGSKDKEMMGLDGIIDDGTRLETIQGLSRTTYPEMKANVLSNGGTLISLDLNRLDKIWGNIEDESGETPNLIVTNRGCLRAYASLLTAQRRIIDTLKLEGGYMGLGFMEQPVIPYDLVPKNTFRFINKNHIQIYRASDIDWMDDDGAVLSRTTDKAAFEATLYYLAEVGTDYPLSCGELRDISEA